MEHRETTVERRHKLRLRILDAYERGDNEEFEEATFIFDTLYTDEFYGKPEYLAEMTNLSSWKPYKSLGSLACDSVKDNSEFIAKEHKSDYSKARFTLRRGSELGHHCHAYETRGDRDTGILVTVVDGSDNTYDVFGEKHRKGSVNNPITIETIGKGEKRKLAEAAVKEIGDIPQESRRSSGKLALLLATVS